MDVSGTTLPIFVTVPAKCSLAQRGSCELYGVAVALSIVYSSYVMYSIPSEFGDAFFFSPISREISN